MIKAILFDVDGTLLNTEEYIYQAFEYSFKHNKHRVISRDEISHTVGKSLADCYRHFTLLEDVSAFIEQHKKFQHENLELVEIFPHTITTLEQLREKGMSIAAITSRAKQTTIQSLEYTGVYPLIDFFVGVEDVVTPKPDPEGLLKALTNFALKPHEAIMVGDSPVDVEAGRNAQTATIGVTYGFHGERIRDSRPDYVIGDIAEVINLIKI